MNRAPQARVRMLMDMQQLSTRTKGLVGLASLEAGDKGKEPLAVFKNPIRAAKAWYVQHTSSPRGFPFPAIFMDKVKGNRLNLI